jgi:hypothetical protein
MPPKAEKKPTTAGKAPAGKAPAEKKAAGKKTAAAGTGEKKKRSKTRKETYSSYIYKGMRFLLTVLYAFDPVFPRIGVGLYRVASCFVALRR